MYMRVCEKMYLYVCVCANGMYTYSCVYVNIQISVFDFLASMITARVNDYCHVHVCVSVHIYVCVSMYIYMFVCVFE